MKILTSCVAQKYGNIKADIATIHESDIHNTFLKWKEISQGKKSAYDVYRGYSWEFIKSIPEHYPTYVISAGYGIINIQDLIVPYKITFSNKFFDKGDSLIPRFGYTQDEANSIWFNKFDNKFNWETKDTVLITCNPDYLKLLTLPEKDNIIKLNDYPLTRLSKWLGAGSHAIANRFVQFITKEYPNIKGNNELNQLFQELDKKYGVPLRTKRKKVDDQFIIDWAQSGKTLNDLRNKGYSCSYQRFTKLQDPKWLKNNPKRKFTVNFTK